MSFFLSEGWIEAKLYMKCKIKCLLEMFFLPRNPMTTIMMMILCGCLVVWRLEVGEEEDGEWRVESGEWYGIPLEVVIYVLG